VDDGAVRDVLVQILRAIERVENRRRHRSARRAPWFAGSSSPTALTSSSRSRFRWEPRWQDRLIDQTKLDAMISRVLQTGG
jgi:hypothetical protein